MGYSMNKVSADTFERINGMLEHHRPMDGCSNAWMNKGVEFFVETTRRDQPDGGIKGTIYDMRGTRRGTMRIDGNGNLVRWAHLPKEVRAKLKSEK